jgi:hypothetical protein
VVVAGLWVANNSISAGGQSAVGVATSSIRVAWSIVTLFADIQHTIPAHLGLTRFVAPVSGDCIAVVALLRITLKSIATPRVPAVRVAGVVGGCISVVTLLAVVDYVIAAELRDAVLGASIIVDVVAIIALLKFTSRNAISAL